MEKFDQDMMHQNAFLNPLIVKSSIVAPTKEERRNDEATAYLQNTTLRKIAGA
jgi:hypothetical protein